MSKQCGRCSKTVYPAEELKCLDQVWHKACFKCSECGMTLNLKNYVGFNKLPYCNAHNPSKRLTATVVAETPEQQRISHMTKLNSGVEYRKEFEKSKGTVMSVADDPATMHARQAGLNASGFNYSGGGGGGGRTAPPPANNNYYDEDSGYSPQSPPVQLPYANSAYSPPVPQAGRAPSKQMYRAVYDYEAMDAEEVSFNEGDIIEDFTQIDDGWGTGIVQSTGQRGMIPANYVEPCN